MDMMATWGGHQEQSTGPHLRPPHRRRPGAATDGPVDIRASNFLPKLYPIHHVNELVVLIDYLTVIFFPKSGHRALDSISLSGALLSEVSSFLLAVAVMGMEHLTSAMNPSSGPIHQGNGTMEAMKELQKLRTETMMETCHQSTVSRDGAIRCPIPRKSCRLYREYDFKAAQDLSDFIVSKASPPHFMGSPPVRASNPLVHDTQFCAWKVQSVNQPLGIPIPTKGCNVGYCVREGSCERRICYKGLKLHLSAS